MTLYALAVIYNRCCADSASLQALLRQNVRTVLVADNSERDFQNAEWCENAGFAYLPLHENKGLSVAYNRGIDYLREHTDATHVLLLDDDTSLPGGFWQGTQRAIQSGEEGIYLPIVQDERGTLSPCQIRGFRVTRTDRPRLLPEKRLTGINSGMAVPLSLFDGYRYDEGYFLDYIDHAFLRDMKARGVRIFITDQVIGQRFADNDRRDTQARRLRAQIFAADFRRFCGNGLWGRAFASLVIAHRRRQIH